MRPQRSLHRRRQHRRPATITVDRTYLNLQMLNRQRIKRRHRLRCCVTAFLHRRQGIVAGFITLHKLLNKVTAVFLLDALQGRGVLVVRQSYLLRMGHAFPDGLLHVGDYSGLRVAVVLVEHLLNIPNQIAIGQQLTLRASLIAIQIAYLSQ